MTNPNPGQKVHTQPKNLNQVPEQKKQEKNKNEENKNEEKPTIKQNKPKEESKGACCNVF